MLVSVVAILEDDARRCGEMRDCLKQLLPEAESIFFESSSEMIAWLKQHQGEVSMISLDFDLPIKRTSEGELIDFGSGKMVAEYLASVPPTCPIIIHSSNNEGALQMITILRAAGWPTARVYPVDDLAWISSGWSNEISEYLSRGLLSIT